jgi:hypothetical protein
VLEVNFVWTSTGSSGGLTAVSVQAGAQQSVLYCEFSTLATTNSVSFQTAPTSSGPWFTEASTTISTTAGSSVVAMRLTGPYLWMRPYIHTASTGTYTFRLIGAS